MRSELSVRTSIILLDRDYPTDFTFARSFKSDKFLRIIGFKAFLDGTLGSRTARMLAPYLNDGAICGMWLERAADRTLERWAKAIHEAGYQISMHAIGDAAFRKALDVLDGVASGEAIHRIEHAQQVDRADVARCRGRVLSMQPLHQVDDAPAATLRLGQDRMAGFFAFRDLADAGATLAFGSDWPVVSPDPMLGMQAAVTGRVRDGGAFRPERCVSSEEAIAAYTTGAAHAMGDEKIGRLTPGCWGDCVVLDRDPFACHWEDELPRVLQTIVGGRVVYDAGG
jgi:hypothetical protein